jgi:hypothetical protein
MKPLLCILGCHKWRDCHCTRSGKHTICWAKRDQHRWNNAGGGVSPAAPHAKSQTLFTHGMTVFAQNATCRGSSNSICFPVMTGGRGRPEESRFLVVRLNSGTAAGAVAVMSAAGFPMTARGCLTGRRLCNGNNREQGERPSASTRGSRLRLESRRT